MFSFNAWTMKRKASKFNKKYSLNPKTDIGSWMCPSCGLVHSSTGWNPFMGYEYPECCTSPQGNKKGCIS